MKWIQPKFWLINLARTKCLLALAGFAPAALLGAGLETQLDPLELKEVNTRIKEFYKNPEDPKGINQIPQKYDPVKKQFIQKKQLLKLKAGQRIPEGPAKDLLQQAQVKATDKFQKHQCETFLKKKFPKLDCQNPEGKASAESNDSVTDLTRSWISDDQVIYNLDRVKVAGRSKLKLWSDDYWRIRYGVTSYRYYDGKEFSSYHAAVEDYSQPVDWNSLEGTATIRSKVVANWSPAEKYDISVGDAEFQLTNQQKSEGKNLLNEDNDVEEWMGICHGWAPAAFMVPRPDKTVKVRGADGITVTWYPHDIRSMASLAWANGHTNTNFVGGRCNAKKVTLQKKRSHQGTRVF